MRYGHQLYILHNFSYSILGEGDRGDIALIESGRIDMVLKKRSTCGKMEGGGKEGGREGGRNGEKQRRREGGRGGKEACKSLAESTSAARYAQTMTIQDSSITVCQQERSAEPGPC